MRPRPSGDAPQLFDQFLVGAHDPPAAPDVSLGRIPLSPLAGRFVETASQATWPEPLSPNVRESLTALGTRRRVHRGSRGIGAGSRSPHGQEAGAETRSLQSARWPCR